jgi:hypothetical protein
MIKRIEDWLLYHLQRRCTHPDGMVSVDILEGCAEGIKVRYCNRCGSIKADWDQRTSEGCNFSSIPHWWRIPDPFRWRG